MSSQDLACRVRRRTTFKVSPEVPCQRSSIRRSASRIKPRIKCADRKFLAYSGREGEKHEASNIETEIY